MQIDFKALEQALAPIAEIGQGELTFDAGGTSITLRVLRPHEEVEAQKYAASALEGDSDGAAVDYLDRFRVGCLSYAIVAVGSQDFRNVDYVDTGEKLENGTPIKVPTYKAMRGLLSQWTRSALSGVFGKFHELLMRTEKEAERAIIIEPADIPTEIDRLRQRIEELRGEMEKAQAVEKTKFSETVANAEAQVRAQAAPQPPAAPPQQESQPPSPQVLPPQARRPISPAAAAPPVAAQGTAPAPTVQVPPPAMATAAPTTAPVPPPRPPSRADSSFIDTSDDDAANAAVVQEHQRLVAMRQRAALGQVQEEEGSALETVHPQLQQGRRRPPHFDAAEVEAQVQATAPARHLGDTADGVPVFAMPSQDLEVAGSRRVPDKGALNRPVSPAESRNPRFQPSRKT
jgi:hypothetical protein